MPLYDVFCEKCERIDENVFLKYEKRNESPCPECGSLRVQMFAPTRMQLVGAAPTKPIKINGLGTFQTNAELRAYQRAHPNVNILAPGDKRIRAMRDGDREAADKNARRQGYNGDDHMMAERKKQRESSAKP